MNPVGLASRRLECQSFPGVLDVSARGLGQLGAQSKDAVPALIEALSHSDSGFRDYAAQALRQIDPSAAAHAGLE